MSKKDLFTRQLETFNNQDARPNAVAETNDTQNAVTEAELTVNSDETRLLLIISLPNTNKSVLTKQASMSHLKTNKYYKTFTTLANPLTKSYASGGKTEG